MSTVNAFNNQKLVLLLRIADFMWEFTMFTSLTQPELANQNFAATDICRKEQSGVFIAGVLSLSPKFLSSRHLLYRLPFLKLQ